MHVPDHSKRPRHDCPIRGVRCRLFSSPKRILKKVSLTDTIRTDDGNTILFLDIKVSDAGKVNDQRI